MRNNSKILKSGDFQIKFETAVQQMYSRPSAPKKYKIKNKLAIKTDKMEVDTPMPVVASTVIEDVNWLQCDGCGKWRIVDLKLIEKFENKIFNCSEILNKNCNSPPDDETTS